MKCFFVSSLFFLVIWNSSAQCSEQLIFSDEFNGNSLDDTKWVFENGNGCPDLCGWGNNELEYYTEDPKNIEVSDGTLKITAVREDINGSAFSSSKIRTFGLHSWKYGRFEARIKLPLGNGLWPAFWMLSDENNWPMTGEIDIMEYRGDLPNTTYGTLHYGSPWPNNQHDGVVHQYSESLANNFHIYAVEWEEDEIRWYLDDVMIHKETKEPNSLNPASSGNTWPWNTNFYMILNLAVGGSFAGSPSANEVELTNPVLEVDYVRVYSTGSKALTEIEGTKYPLLSEPIFYSVPEIEGASYQWSTIGGAQIISGQNTSEVEIKWLSASPGAVAVTVSGACLEEPLTLEKYVTVIQNSCDLLYLDFEGRDLAEINTSMTSGEAETGFNNTENFLYYTRSAATQYDILVFDDVQHIQGAGYENGTYTFQMDVITDAPVNTSIDIQLASSTAWANEWPTGRHTVYKAYTTKTNQWETLTFTLSQTGDPNRASFEDNLDRIIILPNPDSYTGHFYNFDKLMQISVSDDNCALLTSTANPNTNRKQNWSIYPNPARNMVHIQSDHYSEATLSITTPNGKMLYSGQIENNKAISTDFLKPGIYFFMLKSGPETDVQKVVVY